MNYALALHNLKILPMGRYLAKHSFKLGHIKTRYMSYSALTAKTADCCIT